MKRLSLVLVALVASCSGLQNPLANSLEGTVGSNEDLSFDTVEVLRFSTGELQVSYKRDKEGNSETVAKVSVTSPSSGIEYGKSIDLLANNGAVQRAVQDAEDFPALKSGTITFDSGALKADDDTRGSFAATFENDKNLKGTFQAKLKMIE